MDRINRDAIGEMVGRIGCGSLIVAIALLIIIELL